MIVNHHFTFESSVMVLKGMAMLYFDGCGPVKVNRKHKNRPIDGGEEFV